ncbi:hypothetical protein [Paenarthrobacter sp. NCHU4564]|uniref:hypothetical protein n=1 Tax=Paenarthrobacter sp. NCHU4564 TaxID=3451353 RepID=UPI003F9A0F56
MSISERSWKWWKRSEVPAPDENPSEYQDALPSSLQQLLSVDHGAVSEPGVDTTIGRESMTITVTDHHEKEEDIMSSLDEAVKQLLSIEGATGAAIVDYTSGMALAQGGSPGFDLGVAAAGNSNVVSAKLRTMAELGLNSDIEDVLITLDTQYHLINVLNSAGSKGLFVYLVLDRTYANLALARHKLKNLAKGITI